MDMNQFKMSVLALALAGFTTSSAMAQSTKTNAWDGAYGQVGIGWGMFNPSIGTGSYSARNYPVTASNVNNISTGLANLAVGYNYGITSEYVLGIAATYYPGASSGATGQLNIITPVGSIPSPASYQVKNLYSVVLTPGYVIDKDRLVYAKVGYTGATIGLSTPTIAYNTTNLHGYSLGLGYKQILTGSVFAFGEINYAGYSNATASTTTTSGTAVSAPIKGTGTDLLVGIGYRF